MAACFCAVHPALRLSGWIEDFVVRMIQSRPKSNQGDRAASR
jgi:hypothetical protein